VQDAAVAEDLAQEVYIQVFRSIGTFRGDAKLSTWMYRIAVTKALGWERKQKGIRRWKNWFAGNEKAAGTDFHHPGVLAEQKELAAILFKAIQSLPEQQRIAWILIKTEGLSYAETAEIMETTEKAIEALQYRAKANLRKYLQSYDSLK
jgi:RNA polymerase sigma-70 factor (ECF subfamily)